MRKMRRTLPTDAAGQENAAGLNVSSPVYRWRHRGRRKHVPQKDRPGRIMTRQAKDPNILKVKFQEQIQGNSHLRL
jgi:hypothetical protein